jgi:hypothetical protein
MLIYDYDNSNLKQIVEHFLIHFLSETFHLAPTNFFMIFQFFLRALE